MNDKIKELELEIKSIISEIDFRKAMIGILMAEANILDGQAIQHETVIKNLQAKLVDLKAELKDTI